jgi:hypothetical protein
MRLVFTKLETPLNDIEVDYGDGRGFVAVHTEDLTQSGDGWYIQLNDDAIASSIRVRTSSEELDDFKMIKEYQIKDNDGNYVGGNASQITFPLELVKYRESEYGGIIMFPHDITETGEYVGLTSSEARGAYFETIVVTRLDSMGFRGYPIGAAAYGDTLFIKSSSEENH